MAIVTTKLHVEIDPKNPVMESLAVIDALIRSNGGQHMESILMGISEGIEHRMNMIQKKEVEKDGEPVPGPGRSGADPE